MINKFSFSIPPLQSFEDVRQVLQKVLGDTMDRLVKQINLGMGGFGGQRLTSVGKPQAVDDAATKGYVDDAITNATSGTTSTSVGDFVLGGAKLRTVGALTRVISNGAIGESVVVDDGTHLLLGSRQLGVRKTPAFDIDVLGDINADGVYRISSATGKTTTVPFIKTALGTVFTTGTLTFSGGLFINNS